MSQWHWLRSEKRWNDQAAFHTCWPHSVQSSFSLTGIARLRPSLRLIQMLRSPEALETGGRGQTIHAAKSALPRPMARKVFECRRCAKPPWEESANSD